MDYDDNDPGLNVLKRIVRIAVPWIALIIVTTVALSLLADYRRDSADRQTPPAETSSSVEPTPTAATDGLVIPDGASYVVVLAEGLSLRKDASPSAEVLKSLTKDQRLLLVDVTSGWYKVKDAAGAEGWVAAGGEYTQLVEPQGN